LELAKQLEPVVLSKKTEEHMLLDQFPAKTMPRDSHFMLER
jgi:hypothetical protein